MEILEKVAYLKGLAEGLALDKESKEGKLIGVIIDLLDDMALEMQDLRDEQCEIEEGLDAVSDDLSDVESFLYEAFDEDGEDEEEELEEDEDLYGATCPNCGEELTFDEETLDGGGVICPGCGEQLALDASDLPSGCGGCCGSCGEEE